LKGRRKGWEDTLGAMGRDGREGLEAYRAQVAAARQGKRKAK